MRSSYSVADSFLANKSVAIYGLEMLYGYSVANSTMLQLTPLVGTSILEMNNAEDSVDGKLVDSHIAFWTLAAGFNLDLKLGSDAGTLLTGRRIEQGYRSIRLRYLAQVPLIGHGQRGGSMHTISVGFFWEQLLTQWRRSATITDDRGCFAPPFRSFWRRKWGRRGERKELEYVRYY